MKNEFQEELEQELIRQLEQEFRDEIRSNLQKSENQKMMADNENFEIIKKRLLDIFSHNERFQEILIEELEQAKKQVNINTELYQRKSEVASKALQLCRNSLLPKLRFLDQSFNQMDFKASDNCSFGTDGQGIFYNPDNILKIFKKDFDQLSRNFLHMILHCVFQHLWAHKTVDRLFWDTATDICVEATIKEMNLPFHHNSKIQNAWITALRSELGFLTADKIYTYLKMRGTTKEELTNLRAIFYGDSHAPWYKEMDLMMSSGGQNEKQGAQKQDSSQNESEESQQNNPSTRQLKESTPSGNNLSDIWGKLAEQVDMELQHFSQGDTSGEMLQNLQPVLKQDYDYSEFLKKFTILAEHQQINQDDFDLAYYKLGIERYGNMPLVEPLEVQEIQKIQNLVIVIDTSGSVVGKTVQKFLQKTYDILRQEQCFNSEFCIHIIQCDADIQSDVKITNQEEMEKYFSTMNLKGFGGTDFRPAFEYVEQLIKKGEFSDLRGLMYFTDGYGTFPTTAPDYEVAFIFIENEDIPMIPSWAMKIVINIDDLIKISD